MCLSILQIGSLVFSPFFRSGEICFSVCRWPSLAAGARWFLWSNDVGSEVVDLSFFSDFVEGRRRILVQDNTGTSLGRRATQVPCCVQLAYSSTHKASLAMVFAWIWQWWRLGVPSGVRLDGIGVGRRPLALVVAENPRDRFVFLDLLQFYLQSSQDNHFISVYILITTYVASCNLIFN
jgi:hypothetical protein